MDEKNQMQNILWDDGSSWATYREFNGIIAFDSTYLVNKYDMPFTAFIGVNHH